MSGETAMDEPLYAGFDFGTESVRAVIVDRRGRSVGSAVSRYAHGQIVPGSEAARRLFCEPLTPVAALQHPQDWLDSAADASRSAIASIDPSRVRGIGVDFTSCTMLPCRADGTPLCMRGGASGGGAELSPQAANPHAWPKLWKHHGAEAQAARLTALARSRREEWLARYGGSVGLEWFFPKILEVIEAAPEIAAAAEVWLEAGDWFVWQLVGAAAMGGGVGAASLPRSTCQAGYKACWSPRDGYTSRGFLAAVSPELGEAASGRLPGRFVAPGARAGELCRAMSARLGLPEGTPVSAAIIDAHSGVPGAGVGESGTLVMVMGTSGCHMLLANEEKLIPGVAGIVRDGILPGFVGYETGQAAMGDSFDLVRRIAGGADFEALGAAAARIPAGADGVTCLDWFNGCRTPLMDGSRSGVFAGVRLHHQAAHLYRAALEGSAFGLRWIVETLRAHVAVERFVATGGLAGRNQLFMRIVAAALTQPVMIHSAEHGPAQGAAILGALASDGAFGSIAEAVDSMAGAGSVLPPPVRIDPEPDACRAYESAYQRYRSLASMEENR